MTMTRIEIEQNGHTTWTAFVEGGTGMINRRQTARAPSFGNMITAIVEAWSQVNDRDPVTILRTVREGLLMREEELLHERTLRERAQGDNLRTYDDLGNEEPPPTLRHYPPPLPKQVDVMLTASNEDLRRAAHPNEYDPETWGERETLTETNTGGAEKSRSVEFPRRGPGRPRKAATES